MLGFSLSALALSYIVVPGDTLWRIGQKYAVSVDALKAVNLLPGDLIYPGQALEIPVPGETPDFAPLRQQILDYLASQPATYKVYFKDLMSGQSFGIGEDDWMVAASITKVPTVLYLNTLAAQGKVDWQEKVAFQEQDRQGGAGILQNFVKPGDKFSLRVLANLSITISDNIAHRMLLRRLGRENVAAFMRNLGGQTVYPNGQNITTARDMAAYMEGVLDFYRRNPELGRRLLDDMANPIYHIGLPGELPDDVTVAHKEGDVTGVSNDFGVVYGSRPFLFVVLSKGQADPEAGFKHIARLTRLAYDYEEALAKPGNRS
ncbi:MAG TPA: LysM peptidoglycan-binding domain-containing protein [Firmicutes bacterium]|nr:LysM peptidoglycan-binding domain-containing protein [Bacillota bacterium]